MIPMWLKKDIELYVQFLERMLPARLSKIINNRTLKIVFLITAAQLIA